MSRLNWTRVNKQHAIERYGFERVPVENPIVEARIAESVPKGATSRKVPTIKPRAQRSKNTASRPRSHSEPSAQQGSVTLPAFVRTRAAPAGRVRPCWCGLPWDHQQNHARRAVKAAPPGADPGALDAGARAAGARQTAWKVCRLCKTRVKHIGRHLRKAHGRAGLRR